MKKIMLLLFIFSISIHAEDPIKYPDVDTIKVKWDVNPGVEQCLSARPSFAPEGTTLYYDDKFYKIINTKNCYACNYGGVYGLSVYFPDSIVFDGKCHKITWYGYNLTTIWYLLGDVNLYNAIQKTKVKLPYKSINRIGMYDVLGRKVHGKLVASGVLILDRQIQSSIK